MITTAFHKFQFHEGPIKTNIEKAEDIKAKYSFNSMKVRLKLLKAMAK